jgi:hypothetical protein
MNERTEAKSEPHKRRMMRRTPWAVAGVIVLGAMGSGLWDLIAKPGLSHFGRFVLNVVTLGSQSARNAAYLSAALDPTPLSSLFIIHLLVMVPIFPVIFVFLAEFVLPLVSGRLKREVEGVMNDDENKKEEEKRSQVDVIFKGRRRHLYLVRRAAAVLTILFSLALFGMGYVASKVINQSVLIWRVFNANVKICGPYLSDPQEKRLRALFAAMKSRSDYKVIEDELQDIAKRNGILLRDEKLW